MKGKLDHRYGGDRRAIDAGAPQGWKERRRAVERRIPKVAEISFEEWAFFAAKYTNNSPANISDNTYN